MPPLRAAVLALAFAASALPLAGCGRSGGGAASGAAPRVYVDEEKGYRHVVPSGWMRFTDELRSIGGSVFVPQVLSLEEGDPKFLEALPDSMIPQLRGQAQYYFSVVGEPERRERTIGGEPALELRFAVRVRSTDPETTLIYWIVRHGEVLYVLRASFVVGKYDADSPAIDELLDSWRFIPRVPADPGGA